MRRAILGAAALVAAAAVWIAFTLPPTRRALPPTPATAIPGVLHVHSNRSDGRSSPEMIAGEAARAGLKFVIFTDHGDGTAQPDAPAYHHGVLCVAGVEISTRDGHYAALDLPQSPYPLGGDARDVIEDVRRLGGFGIVAHPDSPKEELRWRAWDAPVDAIEVVNLDSGWRNRAALPGWRPKLALASALGTYFFRPAETIARLQPESNEAFERWGEAARRRRVVGLGGTDAHAKLALADVDPGDNRFSLPLPGYAAAFQALAVYVQPDDPLSGDAAADSRRVIDAIRAGRVYAALTGLATPAWLEFSATNQGGTARAGEELQAGDGPVALQVRSNAPGGFTRELWQNDHLMASSTIDRDLSVTAPDVDAVYRAVIRVDAAGSALWAIANPIYVRRAHAAVTPPTAVRSTDSRSLFDGRDATAWQIETDPTSLAAVDVVRGTSGPELAFRYGLATGEPAHQVAAVGVAVPGGLAPFDRLTFRARADKPMRLSIQLRAPAAPGRHERWQRSVYVESTEKAIAVAFADARPIGTTRTERAPAASVESVVFVVDITNAKPGTSGRVWFRDVRLERF